MLIELERQVFTETSTTGAVKVDGAFICYSLEDKDRYLEKNPEAKVKGQSAIPAGKYQVVRTMSPRFKKMLPRLLDVHGFEGILIHTGNTAKDTDGCILPGMARLTNEVRDSKRAFQKLDALIKSALDRGERVTIRISRSEN